MPTTIRLRTEKGISIEVTFVRHGATVWNASKRFQGRTDIELSNEGRAQAQVLAHVLRDLPFTRAYASDLRRAFETAEIIAAPHGVTVTTDTRLREFDFGAWEGLTWTEITARWPKLCEQTHTAASLYQPEGGESFPDVVMRVRTFLDEVLGLSDERILVVTHAGVLHAALAVLDARFEGVKKPSISFSTASVSRIIIEEHHAQVITLNDITHFQTRTN